MATKKIHAPILSLWLTEDKMVRSELIRSIRRGDLFIYPTDTIYGIGCNALKKKSVEAIKKLKKRDAKKPVSVIAPSKAWIRTHFRVSFPAYLKKIPGPFTLLLPKKKKGFLQAVSANENVGVRIPEHVFTALVQEANVPFVTTSVNLSGDPPIRNVDEIPPSFHQGVHWIIDDGPLNGKPSTLIDLSGKKPLVIKRK